jgi:hypothetical protein
MVFHRCHDAGWLVLRKYSATPPATIIATHMS